MATLQLIWNQHTTLDLWSWNHGNIHQTARIVRKINKNVYTAYIGPRGMEPDHMIVIKTARGDEGVEDLTREAEFYERDLQSLQGTFVPRSFGTFRGRVKGVSFVCLLLEYCTGPSLLDPHESSRQIVEAVYALHRVGVHHGDLLDGRHFVRMGMGVRIVDFATAVRHACYNAHPNLVYASEGNQNQCSELSQVHLIYGARKPWSHPGQKTYAIHVP